MKNKLILKEIENSYTSLDRAFDSAVLHFFLIRFYPTSDEATNAIISIHLFLARGAYASHKIYVTLPVVFE